MTGSPSSAPRRTEISGPSGHVLPKRLEPPREQHALTPASSAGRYTRMSSSPEMSQKPSRGTRPWVSPNVPECLRQREQWQWLALRNGSVISKRTAPQRQLPCSGSTMAWVYADRREPDGQPDRGTGALLRRGAGADERPRDLRRPPPGGGRRPPAEGARRPAQARPGVALDERRSRGRARGFGASRPGP